MAAYPCVRPGESAARGRGRRRGLLTTAGAGLLAAAGAGRRPELALQIVDQAPAVLVAERAPEGGHGGAGHAVADPEPELAFGVLGHVDAQVRGPRVERARERPIATAAQAVTDGAVLLEQLLAAGDRRR